MTTIIRPTDGLVSRLLQQQTRTPVATQNTETKSQPTDQVSISHHARQQGDAHNVKQELINLYGYKQEKLESKLIRLYQQHIESEG